MAFTVKKQKKEENSADFGGISGWVDSFRTEEARRLEKYERLKDLDLMIIDNSVRESTVGQLKGHTAQDKFEIFEEATKCGFKEMLVGSFSHLTRVDDDFIKLLVQKTAEKPNAKEVIKGFWGFSEIADYQASKNKIPNEEAIPVGMKKMNQMGFFNVLFEIDLGNSVWDFNKYSIDRFIELLKSRFEWCNTNCPWADDWDVSTATTQSQLLRKLFEGDKPKVRFAVNLRDLPEAFAVAPERVYKFVHFLTTLPKEFNLFAVAFEDPDGKNPPEVIGGWTRSIRQIMDKNRCKAHLLVHVHERYGFCDSTVLQALMDGADGLWASVAAEGAFLGQASSCVTLINMIRMGNKKVLERYNCPYLREAAMRVTRITTGADPPRRQIVFGPRSVDIVFGFQTGDKPGFNLAKFFGEKAPIRLTTMANEAMILKALESRFGKDPQFTLDLAKQMRLQILADLRNGIKEEYMSQVGLAMLMDHSGGRITGKMRDMIVNQTVRTPNGKVLLAQVKERWDALDAGDENCQDDMLSFDSFYNGFMAPYFSCYRCSDTMEGLRSLDMDADGQVDWAEFKLYLMWAMREYPTEILNVDNLLDVAFTKGIMPSMDEEMQKK